VPLVPVAFWRAVVERGAVVARGAVVERGADSVRAVVVSGRALRPVAVFAGAAVVPAVVVFVAVVSSVIRPLSSTRPTFAPFIDAIRSDSDIFVLPATPPPSVASTPTRLAFAIFIAWLFG